MKNFSSSQKEPPSSRKTHNCRKLGNGEIWTLKKNFTFFQRRWDTLTRILKLMLSKPKKQQATWSRDSLARISQSCFARLKRSLFHGCSSQQMRALKKKRPKTTQRRRKMKKKPSLQCHPSEFRLRTRILLEESTVRKNTRSVRLIAESCSKDSKT